MRWLRRVLPLVTLAFLLSYSVSLHAQVRIADNLFDGNDASINGTPVTVAILNNMMQGTPQGVWHAIQNNVDVGAGSAANLTIEATGGATTNRGATTFLRPDGSQFAANSTHRPLRYNVTVANTYAQLATTGGKFYATTLSGWITFNIPDPGVSNGRVFDAIRITSQDGDFAILQYWSNDSPNGGGSACNLHYVNTSGVATTTGHVTQCANGTTLWFSLNYDALNHTAELDFYDTSYVLVTSLTATTHTGTLFTISDMRIGNAEAGTHVSGNLQFENIQVDWSKAFVNTPPTGVTNYWLVKGGAGGGTGSATTATCALTNVAAGDLLLSWNKWETGGGNVTKVCTDGATCGAGKTFTNNTVGNQINGHAGGDPRSSLWYILSSADSGSVTFTTTYSASESFRDALCAAVTKPNGTGTLALDGTASGAVSTIAGLTATSGNTTTLGTNQLCIGTYAEFGAIIGPETIGTGGSNTRPDLLQIGNPGNSAFWLIAATSGFTGQASGTLGTSNQWNAEVQCFNAPSTSTGAGGRLTVLGAGGP